MARIPDYPSKSPMDDNDLFIIEDTNAGSTANVSRETVFTTPGIENANIGTITEFATGEGTTVEGVNFQNGEITTPDSVSTANLVGDSPAYIVETSGNASEGYVKWSNGFTQIWRTVNVNLEASQNNTYSSPSGVSVEDTDICTISSPEISTGATFGAFTDIAIGPNSGDWRVRTSSSADGDSSVSCTLFATGMRD